MTYRTWCAGVGLTVFLGASSALEAQVVQTGEGRLQALEILSERLAQSQALTPLERSESAALTDLQSRWKVVRQSVQLPSQAWVDERTGGIAYAEGGGIPWIPGAGNSLTLSGISRFLEPGGRTVGMAAMEAIARSYLRRASGLLGVEGTFLRLNRGRSGHPADYLWFVDFDVVYGGLPVEGARVVFRVNNGNLIQLGAENLPSPGSEVPATRLTREQALEAVSRYIGGFSAADTFVDRGSLHLLPVDLRSPWLAEGFELGHGRGLAKVWQIVFRRAGDPGTWQARVDAENGEVLAFTDLNRYAQVTGGVGPTATEAARPMPFAYLSSGAYASSSGLYSYTGPVSADLSGLFVKIADQTCGANDSPGVISLASNAAGNIAFGLSGGTDCATPGSGGTGNTHAARTQFFFVNRAKEIARGWLPGNRWLNQQLTANVNLYNTCNAFWNLNTLNFFKSGGGCANTGEIAEVSIHELGHGLDSNDGNGSADPGSGETYGDFFAALTTHSSCIGPGYQTGNCGGYGDGCTSCTGIREIDWAKHVSAQPHTVESFTRTLCPVATDTYVGPCGSDAIARNNAANKREGHCESYISSEALWDLTNRDLANPASRSAWTATERLWYLSRSTAGSAFRCNTSAVPWTSDGCTAGSAFRVFRSVDDDDGNLSNGTPHGTAIFNAFNRHGIACASDPGAALTFAACTPPASPALSVTASNETAILSWTSSGAGVVYDLYRNDLGCNAGFTRIGDDFPETAFTDTSVAGGTTYSYQVVAHPSGKEMCGSVNSACVAVTPNGPAVAPSWTSTKSWTTAIGYSRAQLNALAVNPTSNPAVEDWKAVGSRWVSGTIGVNSTSWFWSPTENVLLQRGFLASLCYDPQWSHFTAAGTLASPDGESPPSYALYDLPNPNPVYSTTSLLLNRVVSDAAGNDYVATLPEGNSLKILKFRRGSGALWPVPVTLNGRNGATVVAFRFADMKLDPDGASLYVLTTSYDPQFGGNGAQLFKLATSTGALLWTAWITEPDARNLEAYFVAPDGAQGAYIAGTNLDEALFNTSALVARVNSSGQLMPGWPVHENGIRYANGSLVKPWVVVPSGLAVSAANSIGAKNVYLAATRYDNGAPSKIDVVAYPPTGIEPIGQYLSSGGTGGDKAGGVFTYANGVVAAGTSGSTGSAVFVKMAHNLTQPAILQAGSGLVLDVVPPDNILINRNVVTTAFRILSSGQPQIYLLAKDTQGIYWVHSAY
jgi:hypothetical protein